MSDRDTDAASDHHTDPRFDNWPVRRYDAYEQWPVERATPDRETEPVDRVEWVGFPGEGSGSAAGPLLYEPGEKVVHEGRIDRENERVVVDDDTEHRRVEDDESLGDHLVDLGDEHDWTWLSSFAREHLDTPAHEPEDLTAGHHLPPGFDHRHTEFQQRNLLDDADADAAFNASHTFADETGRVHVLERDFTVVGDEATDDVAASVEERYLVAEEPRAESRAGDADLVDEREYELELDVEPGETAWVADAEGSLKEWHRAHLGPPEREEHHTVARPEDDDRVY
ncbi:hypothetical protein [Halosimplex salinum]|uniref:hypothetical protein n=1 Tax=Halosimplex salinum TaxID=1710538 RepID=UPI000F488C96|nr:hypothetical protein [Halosimplex salinum]